MKREPRKKAKRSQPSKGRAVTRPRAVRRAVTRAAAKKAAVPAQIPLHDMKAEESKYYMGVSEPVYQKSFAQELQQGELPGRYDEDVLVLQIRDPWWAHSYWDVNQATLARLKQDVGPAWGGCRWILRAYDISFINFDGTNAHRFFDTEVDLDARNWYLNFGSPGTSWCADLGVLLADGRFITVVRSNTIMLPLDGPSWVTDEEWMIPDDDFRRLYGMSVGLGSRVSSPVGKLWQERLKRDVSSRGLASMGVSSPVKKAKGKAAFWLVADCELVVYGATEPDARVTIQGRPLTLRPDGTFTLRFALPDGKQVIPVEATSAKTGEKRSVTPTVTRRTTRQP